MSGHDPDHVAVSADPAAGAAAAGGSGGGGPLGPAAFNAPGTGLTMLGSPEGGEACADGSCAIPVDPGR
jgi:hypothetical protein